MSEPQIIKVLGPYEIEARIKARKEAEAAREVVRRAALPVEEVNTMPGPEDIPKVTKVLDPHEIEARIKARKEAEAAREAAGLAALPVKEYDPMPGPEGIPKVIYEGKEWPTYRYTLATLSIIMGQPKNHLSLKRETRELRQGIIPKHQMLLRGMLSCPLAIPVA